MYVVSFRIDHLSLEPVSHSDEALGNLLHYLTTHRVIQGTRPIANTEKQALLGAFSGSPSSMFKRQVTKSQAVLKPVGEEPIHLHFFIRVMHKAVGVVVNRRNLRIPVATDDFCHRGIVVHPHRHLWVVEPAAAIVDLFEQQGFCEPGGL